MPRKAQPWFRFYTETITDKKILRLTPAQRWLWAAILAAARESPESGRLLIAEGVPLTPAELARWADVPPRDVTEGLGKMRQLGMIRDDDGVIEVINFHDRQFESDNVTARVAASRERSKEQRSNVTTTPVATVNGRSMEHPSNVLARVPAPARAPATETETETEKRTNTSSTAVEGEFESFYRTYPRHVGRGQAEKAWRTATRKAPPELIIAAAATFADRSGDVADRFIPHPASWLNGERWADEPERRRGPLEPAYVSPKDPDREDLPWLKDET